MEMKKDKVMLYSMLISAVLLLFLVFAGNSRADDKIIFASFAASSSTYTVNTTNNHIKLVMVGIACTSCATAPRVVLYDAGRAVMDYNTATTGVFYQEYKYTWDNQPSLIQSNFTLSVTPANATANVFYRYASPVNVPFQSK